jgi:nicotinate-nucleotide--dimethylbenzimidazole phosphoribosyltransferase
VGRHADADRDPQLISADIATLKRDVGLRDVTAADLARSLMEHSDPHGKWGRLAGLAAWLCGVQGQCPPRPLAQVQVVSFGGPSGHTDSPLLTGPAQHVDVPPETDSSEAFAWGRQLADQLIDAGADLLIPVAAAPIAAATLTAALRDLSAVEVIAPDLGLTEQAWSEAVTTIRDRLYRAAGDVTDPLRALPACGSAEASAITGLVIQSALRRTPVILDGRLPLACAMAARSLVEDAGHWWLVAGQPAVFSSQLAVQQLLAEPVLELGVELEDGTGALLAVDVLRAAQQLLVAADLATGQLLPPAPRSGLDLSGWDPDGESS